MPILKYPDIQQEQTVISSFYACNYCLDCPLIRLDSCPFIICHGGGYES